MPPQGFVTNTQAAVPPDGQSGAPADHSTTARGGSPRLPRAGLGRLTLIALAVCAGLVALDALRTRPQNAPADTSPTPPPQADAAALHRQTEDLWHQRVVPELDRTDARTQQAAAAGVRAVRTFFVERRNGSRAFAEAVLSLGGKWALVRSKAPALTGGDRDAHARYLTNKFSELVFSDEELRAIIEAAVTSYLGTLQAAENELLVCVRADVEDIPLADLPAARSDAIFRHEFNRVASQVSPAVARELGVDALREMSSLVAGEIATAVVANVAARLGLSSGLMLAGAGASWATLGASLVAAVVADQVISWAMDEVRDPAGKLETRIEQLVSEVQRLVIEGDDRSTGLRDRLAAFDRARSEVRRAALRQLVLGQSAIDAETPAPPCAEPTTAVVRPRRQSR